MATTAGAPGIDETRPTVSAGEGLSAAEVEKRVRLGLTNAVKEHSSRSYSSIIRANVFTRFNAILGALLVVILVFGSPKDALFGMVLVVNSLVGIVQEVRAKWTLDRLTLLSAPRSRVVREGTVSEVPVGDIVLDDVVEVGTGDQLAADGEVLTSDALELDESLLTGESVPVVKEPGAVVMSGSFVVAGLGRFRATAVGADAYARRLASEAKKFQLAQSDLRDGINTILRAITWIMIPAGLLLLVAQLKAYGSFADSVPGTVAGLVGMVPEGLVLLTSIAFAVSVIVLGRRNVLVQELPAVEGLAKTDVICLDKTGTLTEGELVFNRLEPVGREVGVAEVLGAFGADPASSSSTQAAIAEAFPPPPDYVVDARVPFSSQRKWSAQSYREKGTWVLGAPEVLLERIGNSRLEADVTALAEEGWRVLLLAESDMPLSGEALPEHLDPRALLLFEEKIRPDAAETLSYFTTQGVGIKVISGDNPATVGTVAGRTGVPDVGEPVDARTLPQDASELARVMEGRTVFGRVKPDQKQAMVQALQSKGHTVAMTGDGVNDVLALKKADIGVAMGSGSPAARGVAQLVLLDGRFATLPGVVAEGRRVIANMERVANLFLTKTVYATLLSIGIGLAGWAFILLPRQLTLVSALTIGVPGFVLSFAPSQERYRPGFLKRVLAFTIPAGLIAAAAAFTAGALTHIYPWVHLDESRTCATVVLCIVGLWVLGRLARPLNWWKALLVITMSLGLVLALAVPFAREFFALDLPPWQVGLETLAIAGAAVVALEFIWRMTGWIEHARKKHT
ncbi:MAG: HAD-IC family P-type ATPase [Actinomycetota bacterium]